ncbi:hypothetical protein SDC9_160952 [bioreactor metagenome]|uniref:Uncharacterized protein n=1 Tax=bioreactor metagenome TaxID=1076179 RepID=A0A645FI42_9ZZZZ
MLTYGGREASDFERTAAVDFLSRFTQEPETLTFPEVAVLETDDYGRVLVFLRVKHASGLEEPFLVVFKELRPDGSYLAGPKSILRVREASFYAGLEHHKVRNSWECPLDAESPFDV